MNPVSQLPRLLTRRASLDDDASLETVSRPIHLLKIDASPRASKSNSIALTDALSPPTPMPCRPSPSMS